MSNQEITVQSGEFYLWKNRSFLWEHKRKLSYTALGIMGTFLKGIEL